MSAAVSYAELQVTTHFSFLRGASSPEELFATAALLGISAVGVVDHGSLAGIVRAHEAAKATGVRLIVGAWLDPTDGPPLLVYPTDRTAYGRLCRLLTLGKVRAGKGGCELTLEDVGAWSGGLLAILLSDDPNHAQLATDLRRLRSVFGDRLYCALTRRFAQNDHARLQAVADLARAARVPTVATGDVLYHVESRRMLQDVVTCIRLGCTIDAVGFRKERHADRHLKAPAEVERLVRASPGRGRAHAGDRGAVPLLPRRARLPVPGREIRPDQVAQETLESLSWAGARERYPEGVPDAVALQIRHELNLIERFAYAPYFLP
jgi:error-prone DNA polymerase